MKKSNDNLGFSLMELMIVVVIIALSAGVTFFAMHQRASHYRLRGSTREVLEMMKLAQAAAIRTNTPYRIRITSANTYDFQLTPSAGIWQTPPATDGRLSQAQNLQNGIFFTTLASVPCAGYPCLNPQFRSDGTLNSGGGVSFTDNKEFFTIQWTIGGSVRVQ